MSDNNIVVARYAAHVEAEQAIKELQTSGFDTKRLSIVALNPHAEEHLVGFYNTGDRIKYWGKAGAFWGGVLSLLFGAAFFATPGVGLALVAGRRVDCRRAGAVPLARACSASACPRTAF